jgi:cytidine deaminase
MEFISDRELCTLALKARESAYCPYSGFAVGAALLTNSGKVYTGVNIENAAFTPTVCAERVAFFRAIADGEYDFVKIAISGGKSRKAASEPVAPCGVCRQVMAEFCNSDFEILLAYEGGYEKMTLDLALPNRFDKNNL